MTQEKVYLVVSRGLGDFIPSSGDPGMHGKMSLVVLHRLCPQVWCVATKSRAEGEKYKAYW